MRTIVHQWCVKDECDWEKIHHKLQDALRCPKCKYWTDQKKLTEEDILTLIRNDRYLFEK